MKLEHEHSVLISKLVELGAAGFVNSTSSRSSPPPPGTTPTEIAAPNEGIPLGLAEEHLHQLSPSPKDLGVHEGQTLLCSMTWWCLQYCPMVLRIGISLSPNLFNSQDDVYLI